jgi:hypothetical protein
MVAVVDEKRPADCRLLTVRSLMKIVGRVSPALGARRAERLWFGVPGISLSVQAKRFLKTGSSLNLRAAPFRARWFLHWSPQSTRSSHFDAPSHGTSGPGRMGAGRSAGIKYAQALQAVSRSLVVACCCGIFSRRARPRRRRACRAERTRFMRHCVSPR